MDYDAHATACKAPKGRPMAEVIRLDRVSQPVLLVSGIVGLFTLWGIGSGYSPVLTIVAGLVTIAAVVLLWRPGEPPTLLLLATIHLIQVNTALIYANVTGVPINSLSEYGVDLEYATLVALGGVFCLIVGMSLGNAGPSFWSPADAQAEARTWSPRSAFRFWFVSLGISLFFTELSSLSEGVRQLFIAGAGIQYIGIFLLAYVCLFQRRGLGYFLVAVAVELGIGFTGFFGAFKEVFYVLFIAFAAARPKLNFRSLVAIAFTAVVALICGSFWSAIKDDYRAFLNQGSAAQEVVVPLGDRLSYLADRVSELDEDTLATGFDQLVRRMSYVEFFGATMNFVPASRPHEYGAMTMAAISHVLLPRLFDPDKAPLPQDTVVTIAYTGLPITDRSGVSISIGYPGEFYIDFGVLGVLAGMGILGFLYGKASKYIQRHFSALIGFGATVTLLIPGFLFETSLPKTVGAVCTSFIILLVMSKIVLPVALNALAWKELRSARRQKAALGSHYYGAYDPE
jgi:hypothetical protein